MSPPFGRAGEQLPLDTVVHAHGIASRNRARSVYVVIAEQGRHEDEAPKSMRIAETQGERPPTGGQELPGATREPPCGNGRSESVAHREQSHGREHPLCEAPHLAAKERMAIGRPEDTPPRACEPPHEHGIRVNAAPPDVNTLHKDVVHVSQSARFATTLGRCTGLPAT